MNEEILLTKQKALQSKQLIVIKFTADWCGPCKLLKPMLMVEAENYIGKVQFVYMDIDKFPQVAEILEI